MKVLWLNVNLLLPLDKGGKLRTWHLMKHLRQRHDVTYVCFATAEERDTHGAAMGDVCSALETVPREDARKGSLRFYLGAARSLFDPVPYAVGSYRSRAYRQRVRALLAASRFDRVVCDFLVPAINLPPTLPCPGVLFTHNVEAEIWRRHTETQSSAIARALFRQQWRRMLRFEGETLARFDRVLAVSDADRDTFLRLFPSGIRGSITVVPTGVDTAYFRPMDDDATRGTHIAFVGSMDWLPNEDGVLHFCRDILPRIRRAVPDATFSIIGRSPTAKVRRLAQDGSVEVTGRVEDVRPHLAQAAVVVVPLRIGGGTRLKIFEAMAAGKAVVSTTIGAEGLPAEPGRHLVLADEPDAFADAVVNLIQSPDRREQLARGGRALVESRFDWSAVGADFERAVINAGPVPVSAEAARLRLHDGSLGVS